MIYYKKHRCISKIKPRGVFLTHATDLVTIRINPHLLPPTNSCLCFEFIYLKVFLCFTTHVLTLSTALALYIPWRICDSGYFVKGKMLSYRFKNTPFRDDSYVIFIQNVITSTSYSHTDDNMAKSGFYTHENILNIKSDIFIFCVYNSVVHCTEELYTIMYPYPYTPNLHNSFGVYLPLFIRIDET